MRWLTAIGLILDIIGALMAAWGTDRFLKHWRKGDYYGGPPDHVARKFNRLVIGGLGLIVLGFLLQLIALFC